MIVILSSSNIPIPNCQIALFAQFLISRLAPEYAAHPQDKADLLYRALLLTTTSTSPTPFQGSRSSNTEARKILLERTYPPQKPEVDRYGNMKQDLSSRWRHIVPDYWDEYEDERDVLVLVLVLVDRKGMRRHMLEGLRDEKWEAE